MPIFTFRCPQGHQFERLSGRTTTERDCPECGAVAAKTPSAFAFKVGTQPMNTPQNQRLYHEIVAETLDVGQRRLEERGEDPRGAALVPKAVALGIRAAHHIVEGEA